MLSSSPLLDAHLCLAATLLGCAAPAKDMQLLGKERSSHCSVWYQGARGEQHCEGRLGSAESRCLQHRTQRIVLTVSIRVSRGGKGWASWQERSPDEQHWGMEYHSRPMAGSLSLAPLPWKPPPWPTPGLSSWCICSWHAYWAALRFTLCSVSELWL